MKNGSQNQSLENLQNLVAKIKSLQDLENTLRAKQDVIKLGILFEQLKKLPQYLQWAGKIEKKLMDEQKIDFLSNNQLIKMLDLINKNVDRMYTLMAQLIQPQQTYIDNRKVEVNISTVKEVAQLPPVSREKIRAVIDSVIQELEVINEKEQKPDSQ